MLLDAVTTAGERLVAASGGRIAFDARRALWRGDDLSLGEPGEWSPNGHSRLVRCRDGWMAASLARDDDHSLVPAWTGASFDDEPWAAVIAAAAGRALGPSGSARRRGGRRSAAAVRRRARRPAGGDGSDLRRRPAARPPRHRRLAASRPGELRRSGVSVFGPARKRDRRGKVPWERGHPVRSFFSAATMDQPTHRAFRFARQVRCFQEPARRPRSRETRPPITSGFARRG